MGSRVGNVCIDLKLRELVGKAAAEGVYMVYLEVRDFEESPEVPMLA